MGTRKNDILHILDITYSFVKKLPHSTHSQLDFLTFMIATVKLLITK
jgi:hypothetical protein